MTMQFTKTGQGVRARWALDVLRYRLEMTQAELGRELGVSQRSVSAWEKGWKTRDGMEFRDIPAAVLIKVIELAAHRGVKYEDVLMSLPNHESVARIMEQTAIEEVMGSHRSGAPTPARSEKQSAGFEDIADALPDLPDVAIQAIQDVVEAYKDSDAASINRPV